MMLVGGGMMIYALETNQSVNKHTDTKYEHLSFSLSILVQYTHKRTQKIRAAKHSQLAM